MKNKTEIVKSVSGAMNKTMMKVRKHSPCLLYTSDVLRILDAKGIQVRRERNLYLYDIQRFV